MEAGLWSLVCGELFGFDPPAQVTASVTEDSPAQRDGGEGSGVKYHYSVEQASVGQRTNASAYTV